MVNVVDIRYMQRALGLSSSKTRATEALFDGAPSYAVKNLVPRYFIGGP